MLTKQVQYIDNKLIGEYSLLWRTVLVTVKSQDGLIVDYFNRHFTSRNEALNYFLTA